MKNSTVHERYEKKDRIYRHERKYRTNEGIRLSRCDLRDRA